MTDTETQEDDYTSEPGKSIVFMASFDAGDDLSQDSVRMILESIRASLQIDPAMHPNYIVFAFESADLMIHARDDVLAGIHEEQAKAQAASEQVHPEPDINA